VYVYVDSRKAAMTAKIEKNIITFSYEKRDMNALHPLRLREIKHTG
jgi:hypothetical protein